MRKHSFKRRLSVDITGSEHYTNEKYPIQSNNHVEISDLESARGDSKGKSVGFQFLRNSFASKSGEDNISPDAARKPQRRGSWDQGVAGKISDLKNLSPGSDDRFQIFKQSFGDFKDDMSQIRSSNGTLLASSKKIQQSGVSDNKAESIVSAPKKFDIMDAEVELDASLEYMPDINIKQTSQNLAPIKEEAKSLTQLSKQMSRADIHTTDAMRLPTEDDGYIHNVITVGNEMKRDNVLFDAPQTTGSIKLMQVDMGEGIQSESSEGASVDSEEEDPPIPAAHRNSAKSSLKVPKKEDESDTPMKFMPTSSPVTLQEMRKQASNMNIASPTSLNRMKSLKRLSRSFSSNRDADEKENERKDSSITQDLYATENIISDQEKMADFQRKKSPQSHKKSIKKAATALEPNENSIDAKRFGQNFFNKIIVNRMGFPTITARKRESSHDVLNLKFKGNQQPSEIQGSETKSERMNKAINHDFWNELAAIEKQTSFKSKIEKFILEFNKKAELGIQYLLNHDIIDSHNQDQNKMIANFLLVVEGLNKEMVGSYLGSHHEKNREVLKWYCEFLDFRGLQLDIAMRSLLSRFKLPPEAQQIGRIIEVFSEVYHKDNPQMFNNGDTPFILSYSLLMLNTDAHSDRIPKNKKMTKHTFVENNLRVCKEVPREFLEQMYDNIVKQKFETAVDYIETVYNRIHKENVDVSGKAFNDVLTIAKELIKGANFVKYGRRGKPHTRKVWISEKEDTLFWRDPNKTNQGPRSMPFSEITDVLVGYNSTKVLTKNKVPQEFDNMVFSIISSRRTLDLRASDAETRFKWEKYFKLQLVERKKSLNRTTNSKRNIEKEKLSEIWKVDILPHWENHWDYKSSKPKGFESMSGSRNSASNKPQKEKKGLMSMFFKGKQKTTPVKDTASKHLVLEDREDSDGELKLICKNKSLLLVTLWKRGIPDWLRKILWTISIGNQLEITQSLYEILRIQAKNFKLHPQLEFHEVAKSLKKMNTEVESLTHMFRGFEEKADEKKQSVVNILEAFIFYRPDVGFVKGMSYLVVVLLMYCSEFEAFNCFINLIHSYHFLSFYKGAMRQIEWRIVFFNDMFKKELPNLFQHFMGLDLSTEMFLLDWFLTMFAVFLKDVEIVSRIWDCFLLEGEVYAIKTALAILKYFELELKMLTFDGAINFLKESRDVNEEILFNLIEDVKVSWKDFQTVIENQKVASINTCINEALL